MHAGLSPSARLQSNRPLGAGRYPARGFFSFFLLALVAGGCFVALVGGSKPSDYVTFYDPVARSLLENGALRTPEDELAVRYPPGFPLILAGLYAAATSVGIGATAAVLAFNVVCFASSAVLVLLLATRITGNRAAVLSVLGWCTYPPNLWLSRQLTSEAPFIVLLLGALNILAWATLRQRFSWSAGFACGCLVGIASLIRPIAIALAVPMLLALALRHVAPIRRRAIFGLALVIGNLLTIAPWELWVYNKTDQWIPLSTGGRLSMLDGLTIGAKPDPADNRAPLPADVVELTTEISRRYSELETPSEIAAFLGGQLAERPVSVLKLLAVKAMRSWYGTDSQRKEGLVVVMQVPYLLLVGIGLTILWRRGGEARWLAALLILFTTYFWAMTIIALSILRYMVPLMALLMIPAAWAGSATFDRLFRRPETAGGAL
ncbi:MAG: hypothetical protein GY719_10945 [bacterium]|nr:hypothetical protein [bacterium]